MTKADLVRLPRILFLYKALLLISFIGLSLFRSVSAHVSLHENRHFSILVVDDRVKSCYNGFN